MGDYTFEEIYSIVVMQSFSGISLMCIFILMGLGLYIIFGQMGVINMAHAEFLVLGSYTMCLFSKFVTENFPAFTVFFCITNFIKFFCHRLKIIN